MQSLRLILVAILVVTLLGCVPGISWLPDSSGFVFTTASGDLVVYDFASRKQKVLVHNRAASLTSWPAVSPNGKSIALASLVDSDDKVAAVFQIKTYDLQGKLEFESEAAEMTLVTGKDLTYSTQVVWSADGKQILVYGHGMANQGDGFDCTILFEIATGKIQTWDQYMPAKFDGTPVRPDGKGFLLVNVDNNDYVWMDWNGKKQKVNSKVDVLADPSQPDLVRSAMLDSKWIGNKAVMTIAGKRYVVDTDKLEFTVEELGKEVESKIDEEEIHKRVQLASGIELLMLNKKDPGPTGSSMRVVARTKGEAKLKELVAPVSDQLLLMDASPDKKHVVVRGVYGYRGAKGDKIIVINNTGEVHDSISIKARGGPSARYEDK